MSDEYLQKALTALQEPSVFWALDLLREKNPVGKYQRLQHYVDSGNKFYENPEFQKLFCDFYRVRLSRIAISQIFRKLAGKKRLSFEVVLRYFNEVLQNDKCYASYASKVLHTLDRDMPILDGNVAKVLGIPQSRYQGDRNRAIQTYADLIAVFKKIKTLKTVAAPFDAVFPNHSDIPLTKKIDFVFWVLGTQNDSGI